MEGSTCMVVTDMAWEFDLTSFGWHRGKTHENSDIIWILNLESLCDFCNEWASYLTFSTFMVWKVASFEGPLSTFAISKLCSSFWLKLNFFFLLLRVIIALTYCWVFQTFKLLVNCVYVWICFCAARGDGGMKGYTQAKSWLLAS